MNPRTVNMHALYIDSDRPGYPSRAEHEAGTFVPADILHHGFEHKRILELEFGNQKNIGKNMT